MSGVFAPIIPQLAQPGCIAPTAVRDLFLHALFARLTLNDNSTVEFETKYDPITNTIELQLPDCALQFFDTIAGMQRGPRLQTFMGWLVGELSSSDVVAGGLIDSDLTTTGNSASTAEQILATVTVPADTLSFGVGIRIKAWGTFASNAFLKTVKLKFGSTIVATNDITVRPSGNTWSIEAVIFQKVGAQESIGKCSIGAVAQSDISAQPIENESSNISVTLTGKTSSPAADHVICRGLYLERI